MNSATFISRRVDYYAVGRRICQLVVAAGIYHLCSDPPSAKAAPLAGSRYTAATEGFTYVPVQLSSACCSGGYRRSGFASLVA